MSKLTINPFSPDFENEKKILRNRDGKKLTRFSNVICFFWKYGDGGSDHDDKALEIHWTVPGSIPGGYGSEGVKRLNVSGSCTYYTHPALDYWSQAWVRMYFYAWLPPSESPRPMTFWVYGLKVNVIANDEMPFRTTNENFIAKTERTSGHIFVNDVDRGPW